MTVAAVAAVAVVGRLGRGGRSGCDRCGGRHSRGGSADRGSRRDSGFRLARMSIVAISHQCCRSCRCGHLRSQLVVASVVVVLAI